MHLIGIDIGGTKVSICLGDVHGNIISHQHIKTLHLGGPKEGIKRLLKQIDLLLDAHNMHINQIDGIGLALPGPLSIKDGILIAPPNLPGWINVPIVHHFQKHLDRPIFMNNDANAGALAEWMFGSAKNVEHLIYLTMSTGIGGGIVLRGELLMGRSDSAGEVGHFVLDPQGPQCPCGQKGCFEVFCGGGNIAKMLQIKIRQGKKTKILDEAGRVENVDMKSLISAMQKQDPFAMEVWEIYIEKLAQGIGILLMVLNPDAIILGTIAMYTPQELMMTPLLAALPRFTWSIPLKQCRIEASKLGKKIGDLGALSLAINGLKTL